VDLEGRLSALRQERGFSQEALAELVGVSRQAVARWESGSSVPELEKLVALGAVFGVTLDSLVKDEDCGARPRCSGGPRTEILAFLCRAKRVTYAGHGHEVTSSRPGSHDLAYEEGRFLYYDSYLGGELFTGEEAVWEDGVPFWSMNYAGRVLAERFSGDFLKEALFQVSEDLPYRGPSLFQKGDFTYHCRVEGVFGWFHGTEEIYYRGALVYDLLFHGGAIR
jgi:transcriptional regulator with XRE-family HTH domain